MKGRVNFFGFGTIMILFLFLFQAPDVLANPVQQPPDSLTAGPSTSQTEIEKVRNANLIPPRNDFEFSMLRLARGLLGIFSILLISLLFSRNRRNIDWRTVLLGLSFQIILALLILQVPAVQAVFDFGGKAFVKILDFTDAGTEFLFRSMATQKIEQPLQNFAIRILPTIIFFSALTSVLFYFGIIQKVVWLFARVLLRFLKISGAESLAVTANIFIGQAESPLMIKAYLEKMNRSEIMLVMSAGLATMAGGVLALYINFLGGDDPVQRIEFARHLLAASVMAAPGVVVIAKILEPQTEEITRDASVSMDRIGGNVLEALNNGTFQGVKLAVIIGSMLLVFLAFIAMFNYFFLQIGDWTGLNDWVAGISKGRYDHLSMQFILGYLMSPLMWLIGIDSQDITLAGTLLGEKIIMTEFIGYIRLAEFKTAGLFHDPRSVIMSTYILCGFANFASIGMLVGAISSLAPGKKAMAARLGMRAFLAGTLASLLSATIVGVILA